MPRGRILSGQCYIQYNALLAYLTIKIKTIQNFQTKLDTQLCYSMQITLLKLGYHIFNSFKVIIGRCIICMCEKYCVPFQYASNTHFMQCIMGKSIAFQPPFQELQ